MYFNQKLNWMETQGDLVPYFGWWLKVSPLTNKDFLYYTLIHKIILVSSGIFPT